MKEKAKKALLRASGAVMLREFAKALAEMKTAEIKEAAENVSITKSPKQVLKKQQNRDYFVPRKMGKVCLKPKKRF